MVSSEPAGIPQLVAVPLRLSVHGDVLAIVDVLEEMQRTAFSEESDHPTALAARAFAEVDFARKLMGPAGPPSRIVDLWQRLACRLSDLSSIWREERVVEGVRWTGTSLMDDFHQAGLPGGVALGPVGSTSMHGAAVEFAAWIGERVAHHESLMTDAPVRTHRSRSIRSAWCDAAASMSTAEQDPSLWSWVRMELDAEYSRLLPLPTPFASDIERSLGASKATALGPGVWSPKRRREAILAVLFEDRERGELKTWADVATAVNRRFPHHSYNYDETRSVGAALRRQGLVESKALTLTLHGVKVLRQAREHQQRS